MNAEPAIAEAFSSGAPAPARIAVVGNAPGRQLCGATIDACDWVVRFNNAPGLGGAAGSRTSHLVLLNRGGQAREWAQDPGFAGRIAVRAAASIAFTFPRRTQFVEDHDGRDWTDGLLSRLRRPASQISALSETTHRNARRSLTTSSDANPNPSSGFLVGYALAAQFAETDTRLKIFGFGFDGWPGHPWAAERGWFEARDREGRLELHHS